MAEKKTHIVGISYFTVSAYGFILAALSPLLPSIAQSFNLSLAQTGVIFTVNFAGFATFIIASGLVSDRFGKRKIVLFCAGGMASSLLLLGLSPNYVFMLLSIFFCGGFSGSLESMVNAMLADFSPTRESRTVNIAQAFFGVGALIGPILAGFWISWGMQWRWFYILSGFVFAVIFYFYCKTSVVETRNSRVHWSNLKVLFSSKKLIILCVCMFCCSGAEVGSWGWMSTFFKETAGFAENISGIAVGIFWLFVIIGRLLSVKINQRIDERKQIVFLSALASVSILFMSFFRASAMLWVIIPFLGLGFSAQWPLILVQGLKIFPDQSGAVSAILVCSCGVGMTVVPQLIGLIADKIGIMAGILLPAVFTLFIMFAFWTIFRKETETANR